MKPEATGIRVIDEKEQDMADMQDVWGFERIVSGQLEGATTGKSPEEIMEALNFQAKDRAIDPAAPSDALDASRDLIILDAIGAGGDWQIANGTLYVAYAGGSLESLMEQFPG